MRYNKLENADPLSAGLRPDLFQKACELERLMHERAVRLGRGEIWFTSKHKPLSEVATDLHQTSLFDEEQEACEPGYCRL